MKYCKMMIGNSSSGIIEAASFNIPVVNIGNRQEGREISRNVVHANNNSKDILNGYHHALDLLDSEFDNIYGDGNSSDRIVKILLDNENY